MVVAAVFVGCYDYDKIVVSGDPVRVDMAFSLSGSTANKTRMAETVVQNGSAREFEILHVIPLINDVPTALEWSNYEFVNKGAAQFFRANCKLETGVNEILVYAKAQAEGDSKAHNGSLTATFPDPISDETNLNTSISFSPVPMVSSTTAPTEAGKLATYLTNIANAKVTMGGSDYSWETSNNSILKKLYQNFTNKGEMIAGSAANVKVWGNQLKKVLTNLTDAQELQFQMGSVEDAIRDEIVAMCEATGDIDAITYPRSSDLPDGAIGMKWNDTNKEFVVQTTTTTTSPLNTITRFVYPPELYYFVDSSIKTSEEMVDYASLYASKNTWELVLSDEKFSATPKTVVEETTKAVALVSPVQYAVAQLKVTIKANGETLTDGATTPASIPINSGPTNTKNYFPLTGVIVTGQRPVDYQFEQSSSGEAYVSNVKFVYDSQVKTKEPEDTESDKTYYFLENLTESPSKGPTTLVLQSYDGEKVNIILEFQNDSNTQFYGVDQQIIYPGTRFYLVGEIDPNSSSGVSGGDATSTGRVFTKDYTTLVNVTVNSLAGAYNVMPNILSSNLEIGVETTPKWIAATPTTVILE